MANNVIVSVLLPVFRQPWQLPDLHVFLTLNGKSWKTHPDFFPKFQFSGTWQRQISGKLNYQNFLNYSVFVKKEPKNLKLKIGWKFQVELKAWKLTNKGSLSSSSWRSVSGMNLVCIDPARIWTQDLRSEIQIESVHGPVIVVYFNLSFWSGTW